MSERVVVAMSGGVDSSVAALLLKEAGLDVVGLFLRNGVSEASHAARPGRQGCCSLEDAADARRVADALGIPFYALDYGNEFERIVDRFAADYNAGRTPSPCVLCNRWLKFGSLVEFARGIGASAVATGHYARVERREGRAVLLRALDRSKDQSYFLAGLEPAQLDMARFPVGALRKTEVRELARRANLKVAEKPESMGICFVPSGDYRDLLEIRSPGARRKGEIVDRSGRVLGAHAGFQDFTIGQRHGLGIASTTPPGERTAPTYVTGIDAARNRVLVGPRCDLARCDCVAGDVVWTSRPPPGPGEEISCSAQVRHRSPPAPATAMLESGGRLRVRFKEPVEAVTPGQALVLYDGDVVLGGGFID